MQYIFLLLFIASFVFAGMVYDKDGHKYKTVKIGKQEWMAEDYRFESKYSRCANLFDDPDDCVRVYSFYAIIDAEIDVCPIGWRLPTMDEFIDMNFFIMSDYPIPSTEKERRKFMKEVAYRLLSTKCKNGKNTVGFNIGCSEFYYPSYGFVIHGKEAIRNGRPDLAYDCVSIGGGGCPGSEGKYLLRCIKK